MNLKKRLGSQVVAAIVFATMLLFSGFVFEGSENSQTILMLIIALYFSVMTAFSKESKQRCVKNCKTNTQNSFG